MLHLRYVCLVAYLEFEKRGSTAPSETEMLQFTNAYSLNTTFVYKFVCFSVTG